MYKFANTLLTKLNACNAVTVKQRDSEEYVVTVDLGSGYNNKDWKGGYWADTVRITDERLELVFSVYGGDARWDDDRDYSIAEGMVHMHYADFGSGNLAYTSALEHIQTQVMLHNHLYLQLKMFPHQTKLLFRLVYHH